MNKIFLIIQREYKFHLSQRSFWLMTVLLPLLFGGGYYFFQTDDSGNSDKEIWVIDRTALYAEAFTNCAPNIKYISLPQDTIPAGISPLATLLIGEDLLKHDGRNIIFYSSHEDGVYIKHQLTILLTDYLYRQKLAQLPEEIRRQVDVDIIISDISSDEIMPLKTDNKEFNIHLILSTLIYLFIFMYSAQVLQSTVQEKNNRMVEILLTSVKAKELIYGKIIAIGLCGITQFCIWGISLILIYLVGRETIVFDILSHIDIYWCLIFLLCFIGGFLLYGALFAIIGSYINPETDSRQFVLPVSLFSILSFYVGIYSLNDIYSPLATWCTYIPFTSPIVLVTRFSHDISPGEIFLSVFLLFLSASICIHIASRIYQSRLLIFKKR